MKKIILLLSLFALVTVSCVKAPQTEPTDPTDPESELGFTVPDNFDWKTIKEIKISVAVTAVDAQSKDKLHVIKIYNSPLLNSGSLIASGAATSVTPYNVTISIASPTDTLYIYEVKSNGLVQVTPQKVTSSNLNVALVNSLEETLTKNNAFTASNVTPPTIPAMPFPTNYDVTVNSNSSLTLTGFNTGESSSYGNTYKSYYIPQGFTRTSDINFSNWLSHSILYVKGTLTLNSNIALDKCSIVILDGGTVNFKKLDNGGGYTWPVPFVYIQDGGTLDISKSMEINNGAIIVNKGILSSSEDISANGSSILFNEGAISISKSKKTLSITNGSVLYNSGTIDIPAFNLTVNTSATNDAGVITTETIYITNNSVINNHGEIVATEKFSNSGGGTVNNFCRIIAYETDSQGLIAYLKEGSLWHSQKFYANNSTFNMDSGSMFLTEDIKGSPYKMKFISTSSSFALVKNTGDMPDLRWAASEIKGNIEFVHTKLVDGTGANGRDLYSASFTDGAILSKEQTKNIVGTSCNQSLGQIVPGGGVPVDPNPEFITYFPSQTGWGTYAFEDLWPNKGDYDLNDMVLKFRLSLVSNSSNKVTKIIFDYSILAVGASKTAGVAFQLDNINAANIGSVTGQVLGGGTPFAVAANGTEIGVNLAVIPIFNSALDIVQYEGFLNTDKSKDPISAPIVQMIVTLSTPVDQSQLTMNGFNLFISVDSRGKEIHLPSFAPTSKFNSQLVVGRSLNANDIYKYQDGMMWGLMFPDSFAYPIERTSIIEAYTHFAEWATSGGIQYSDWYSNGAGFRNSELIY